MESDTLTAGKDMTVIDTEFCKVGVAICYDVRFPEWFRKMALAGAKLIVLPAAFNITTGPAHWDLTCAQGRWTTRCTLRPIHLQEMKTALMRHTATHV